MTAALDAISRSGGEAWPEGGGWWKGTDGKRLLFDPKFGTDGKVVTRTIYALTDRGYLETIPEKENRPWKMGYRLTGKNQEP